MSDTGDRGAREERVRQWMNDYGSDILRICFAYLSDSGLAEDAMQETFLKAWKGMDKFERRNGSSVKTWLVRIAINVCRDHRRSNWFRRVDLSREMDVSALKQEDMHPEKREMLMDILKLPDKYKSVILLYFYEQMSQQEVAEVLGISRSLVNYRLHKALDMLKIAWGEEELR